MTDKPILFSAPMILALINGWKTQTRRVITKNAPATDGFWFCDRVGPTGFQWTGKHGSPRIPFTPPCAVGDRLWVRETLEIGKSGFAWQYKADSAPITLMRDDPRSAAMIAWAHHKMHSTCVSIHMPRWASRLTLTVADVRVQRLQDISAEDARAEGMRLCEPRSEYRRLWDFLHSDGAWDLNPWIAAYTFTVEKRNIDREAA